MPSRRNAALLSATLLPTLAVVSSVGAPVWKTPSATIRWPGRSQEARVASGLANSPWPKEMCNERNSSQSRFRGGTTGRVRWVLPANIESFESSDGIRDSVTVGIGGRIYALGRGETDGPGVYVCAADGRKLATSREPLATPPTIAASGRLYGGIPGFAPDAGIVRLGKKAERLWFTPTQNRVLAAPTVTATGLVVVGSLDSNIYCVSRSGPVTRVKTGHYVRATAAIGPTGLIYVQSYDNKLYVLSPTGALVKTVDSLPWGGFYYLVPPVVAPSGDLYFVQRGYIYAVSPTFHRLWTLQIEYGDNPLEPPSVSSQGLIYVRDTNSALCCLAPNGSVRWRLGRRQWGALYSPSISSDGLLYTAQIGGRDVLCFSNAGRLVWRKRLSETVGWRPVIGPNDTVLVPTTHHLWCLK